MSRMAVPVRSATSKPMPLHVAGAESPTGSTATSPSAHRRTCSPPAPCTTSSAGAAVQVGDLDPSDGPTGRVQHRVGEHAPVVPGHVHARRRAPHHVRVSIAVEVDSPQRVAVQDPAWVAILTGLPRAPSALLREDEQLVLAGHVARRPARHRDVVTTVSVEVGDGDRLLRGVRAEHVLAGSPRSRAAGRPGRPAPCTAPGRPMPCSW